jgi:hypothetical protein
VRSGARHALLLQRQRRRRLFCQYRHRLAGGAASARQSQGRQESHLTNLFFLIFFTLKYIFESLTNVTVPKDISALKKFFY